MSLGWLKLRLLKPPLRVLLLLLKLWLLRTDPAEIVVADNPAEIVVAEDPAEIVSVVVVVEHSGEILIVVEIVAEIEVVVVLD